MLRGDRYQPRLSDATFARYEYRAASAAGRFVDRAI
jgi:hypothetical protein